MGDKEDRWLAADALRRPQCRCGHSKQAHDSGTAFCWFCPCDLFDDFPDPRALQQDAERWRLVRAMANLESTDRNVESPVRKPRVRMEFPRVPKDLNGYVWDAPTGDELDAKIDALRALSSASASGKGET